MVKQLKGARGEAVIVIDEDEYPILFTNRAIAEAEQRCGKTITYLLQGAGAGNLGMSDLAALLTCGLEAARKERGGGKPVQMGQAYDLLDRVGFTRATTAVISALAPVIGYDPDEEGGDDEDAPPAMKA